MSRGFDSIFNQFRRSFDELLTPFFPLSGTTSWTDITSRYPLVDVIDYGDHYTVLAELPGFDKEMVDVQVNRNSCEIRAEMKSETKEDGSDYLQRERAYESFQRYISFPEEVITSHVNGTMKDGILKLEIAKKEPHPEERYNKVHIH